MPPTESSRTIGLFGGSFNPPHMAHVLAAAWALATGEVDEVWVVPTGGHPFGKPLAPFAARLEMCRRAFACFGERARVLDAEREEKVHYSIDTLRSLAAAHPGLRWRWIVGADILGQAAQWRDFDEIRRLAPLLVVGRGGHGAAEASRFILPDVSSTLVRSLLAKSGSAAPELDGLVPGPVLRYIHAEGLYAS